MSQGLLESVRRYADIHTDRFGVARTPVPGLLLVRATSPGELMHAIQRPLVALVVQGRKRVSLGADSFDFGAGDSLLIAADVPTVSQVTHAYADAPYYSFVLELDLAIIADLVEEMGAAEAAAGVPVAVGPTEPELADAADRLLRRLDQPAVLPLFQDALLRELHLWLLAGRHGASIRRLGLADSHQRRIARAVAVIRENYASSVGVERLADEAGMSLSTFHQHFRAVTSLSPLQFQKQLRLIEARRRMLSEGDTISQAAYGVGYESVTQFTREYSRLFGAPPARDVKSARQRLLEAA